MQFSNYRHALGDSPVVTGPHISELRFVFPIGILQPIADRIIMTVTYEVTRTYVFFFH